MKKKEIVIVHGFAQLLPSSSTQVPRGARSGDLRGLADNSLGLQRLGIID
jgi:hypothetical protein